MAKSTGNCGFGHIYWRNTWWKTSFFLQCYLDISTPTFSSYITFHLARFNPFRNSVSLFYSFQYFAAILSFLMNTFSFNFLIGCCFMIKVFLGACFLHAIKRLTGLHPKYFNCYRIFFANFLETVRHLEKKSSDWMNKIV